MWRGVGIERNGGNLTGALGAVRGWEGFAVRVGPDRVERLTLLNMLLVARLLTTAALLREESRGTHFRKDFPRRDDERWQCHVVHRRGHEPRLVRGPLAGTLTEPTPAEAAGSRA
jgi:L-aspartate oxidase